MTETVMPKEVTEALKAEYVAPFVAYLCHDSCTDNGALYEVGAGYIAKQRWQRSAGHQYDVANLTPESIRDSWSKVGDFSTGATNPESNQEMMAVVMTNLENKSKAKPAAPAKAVTIIVRRFIAGSSVYSRTLSAETMSMRSIRRRTTAALAAAEASTAIAAVA